MQAVRNILRECYGNKDAVTDELVDCILKPGLLVRDYQRWGVKEQYEEYSLSHVYRMTCLISIAEKFCVPYSQEQHRCSWTSSPIQVAHCQRISCARHPAQSACYGVGCLLKFASADFTV